MTSIICSAFRLRAFKKRGGLRHLTRNTPRRREEVLDGGALYWVIRGVIRVRQRIVDIESGLHREDGAPLCALVLDCRLVRTQPIPFRPFQGWRYLSGEKTPKDLGAGPTGPREMPADMERELQDLGLL